jgi:transcriptional regulator with XRE-family HTH domain
MENLICDKIRILRITKGYSQSYIALQLKVSQGYYSKIENGCKPISDYYLKRLSKILDVNLLD